MATQESVFSSVARGRHMPFYERKGAKGIKTNYAQVAQFLQLDRRDINRITDHPQGAKKILQNRVPTAIKFHFDEIANICEIVAKNFDGDVQKTQLWFQTKNYFFGDLSPKDMIRFNRYETLKKFILSASQGHLP